MSLFSKPAIDAAQAAQRMWAPPASVALAQYFVESACGRFEPFGSNNPFGIKAVAGQPSVVAWTHEVVHGATISVQAPFRKFSSLDEAFEEHARLLAVARPYRYAMQHCGDPRAFARALTGVYATAPGYGETLVSIMDRYDLYGFDVGAGEAIDAQGFKPAGVAWAQETLEKAGFACGGVDGELGPETSGALKAFQERAALPRSGALDSATVAALETLTAPKA